MLTEACQHPIVKTAFKSVKRILRSAITNAQTNKQNKRNLCFGYYINKDPQNDLFIHISVKYIYRYNAVTKFIISINSSL